MLHQSLWRRQVRYIFPLFTEEAGNQSSKAHKLNWRSQRWWWQTVDNRTAGGILQLPTQGPMVPRGAQALSFFMLACPDLKRRHSLLAAAVTSPLWLYEPITSWPRAQQGVGSPKLLERLSIDSELTSGRKQNSVAHQQSEERKQN